MIFNTQTAWQLRSVVQLKAPLLLNSRLLLGFVFLAASALLCYLNLQNSFHHKRLPAHLHVAGEVVIYNDLDVSSFQSLLRYDGDLLEFVEKPMLEKCQIFADSLQESDWSISELKDLDYTVDALDGKKFFNLKFQELSAEDRKNAGKIKDILHDLNSRVEKNNKVELLVSRLLSNLRIYEQCYIDRNHVNRDCLDLELRLFPWLTFESPVFERWDGTVKQDWPNLLKFYKEENLKYPRDPDNGCYLNQMKANFKGRGIAISIGDQLRDEAINLITVLRHLGNELPIQFVHKGDLDFQVKRDLIAVARNDIVLHDNSKITNFKQEIWFVDTKRCFREQDYSKFNKFSNKWLLVLFNSFDDMLLMDTDAVPFVKPLQFFKLGDFKHKGAFFFKDRETKDRLHVGFDKLLMKLLPQDLENLAYGVARISDSTLENNYFKRKSFHFMESGIVVLNKRKHLAGILLLVQLQFWKPISKYTYGDKELFWLGQVLVGDEDFEFNPNHALGIGELRKNDFNLLDSIVGVQPAHIAADDRSLLWVNSGLEVCKRHTWEKDIELDVYKNRFKSVEDLKHYYTDAINLRAAIVPPSSLQEYPNDIGEPTLGWNQRKEFGCDEYYWGLYSRVGPESDDEATIGKVIHFNEEEVEKYNRILRIWVKKKTFEKEK